MIGYQDDACGNVERFHSNVILRTLEPKIYAFWLRTKVNMRCDALTPAASASTASSIDIIQFNHSSTHHARSILTITFQLLFHLLCHIQLSARLNLDVWRYPQELDPSLDQALLAAPHSPPIMFASRNPHAFKVHQPDKENMIASQSSTGPFKTPMAQRTLHPSKGMHTVGPKRMQNDIKDGSKTEFKSRIAPSLNRNGGNMASPFMGNGKGKEADGGKQMMGGSEYHVLAFMSDL